MFQFGGQLGDLLFIARDIHDRRGGGHLGARQIILCILDLGFQQRHLPLRVFFVGREGLHLRRQPLALRAHWLDQSGRVTALGELLFQPGFLPFQPLIGVSQLVVGLAGLFQCRRQLRRSGRQDRFLRRNDRNDGRLARYHDRRRGREGWRHRSFGGAAFREQPCGGGLLLGIHAASQRIPGLGARPVFHPEAEPHPGLHRILGLPAPTLGNHDPEIGLGRGKALIGGGAIISGRRGIILGHAASVLEQQTEVVLGAGKSAISRLLIPARGQDLVFLHAAAGLVGQPEIELGLGDAFFRRLLEPEVGFEQITPDAAPGGIHVARIELRGGQPLLRRLQVIFESLPLIDGHAAPLLVGEAEVVLRHGETLFGRPTIPFQSFGVVLFQAGLARIVGVAELGLRLGIGLPGPGAQLFQIRPGLGPAGQPATSGEHQGSHQDSSLHGPIKQG